MDLLDLLGRAAHHLFRALVLVGPLLLWQASLRVTRRHRSGNGFADATVVAGGMVGLACLAVLLPPMALTWDAIMAPDGVWDLTLADFLERALLYELRAMPALLDAIATTDERSNILAWCGFALLIWALRMIAVWLSGRARSRRRLAATEIVVFAISIHAVIYLGLLVLWAINQLNFWVLLVLILLLQDARHNHPPIVRRVVTALTGGRANGGGPNPVRAVD